jgi:hypothetical protein
MKLVDLRHVPSIVETRTVALCTCGLWAMFGVVPPSLLFAMMFPFLPLNPKVEDEENATFLIRKFAQIRV